MKYLLLFWLTTLIFPMNLSAQNFSVSAAVDELHQQKFISEEETVQLLQESKRPFFGDFIKSSFIYSLGNLFMQRDLPENMKGMNIPLTAMVGMEKLFPIDTAQVNPDKPSRLNQQLLKMDLIDNDLYLRWVEITKTQSIAKNKGAMLLYYAAQNFELDQKEATKKQLLVFVEKCQQLDLLASKFKNKKEELAKTINVAADIVGYLLNGTTIDLNKISKNPKEGYTEFFQKINESFTAIDFNLKEFDLVISDDEGEYKKVMAHLELIADNISYRDTFYYSSVSNHTTFEKINITRISNDVTKVINDILLSNNSIYKFYAIDFTNDYRDKNKRGFAFLKKEQYFKFQKELKEFRVIGPHPSSRLTPEMIEIYDQEFVEMGFIETSKLPEIKDSITEFTDFFTAYEITKPVNYRSLDEKAYTPYLIQVSAVIGEEFKIEPISEVWDTATTSIELAFYLNGKKEEVYMTIFEKKNDITLYNRIKELLNEADLKRKFVSLNQQTSPSLGYGYFTEEQIEWIKLNSTTIYPLIFN